MSRHSATLKEVSAQLRKSVGRVPAKLTLADFIS